MRSIEDCWEDSEVYHIQFKTNKNQKISKMIVLDMHYSIKEVEDIIFLNFNRVKEVIFIEEIGESLSLKKKKLCFKSKYM